MWASGRCVELKSSDSTMLTQARVRFGQSRPMIHAAAVPAAWPRGRGWASATASTAARRNASFVAENCTKQRGSSPVPYTRGGVTHAHLSWWRPYVSSEPRQSAPPWRPLCLPHSAPGGTVSSGCRQARRRRWLQNRRCWPARPQRACCALRVVFWWSPRAESLLVRCLASQARPRHDV